MIFDLNFDFDFVTFFAFSGRTDLRKGVSEAKFDLEADGDVKKSPAPPKSTENHEKPKKNRKKDFLLVNNFSIRNRLKRVLAKFCRSKTVNKTANKQRKTANKSRKFENF